MSSNTGDPNEYWNWVRQQLEERQLSLKDVAGTLKLSVSSLQQMIWGKIPFASISYEILEGLEQLLGEYPAVERSGGLRLAVHTRGEAEDAEIDDLIKNIEADLREKALQELQEREAIARYQNLASEQSHADAPCDRCGAMLGPLDRRCPECDRPFDESH